MGVLTDDMKRLVAEQKLAFHANRLPRRIAEPLSQGVDPRVG